MNMVLTMMMMKMMMYDDKINLCHSQDKNLQSLFRLPVTVATMMKKTHPRTIMTKKKMEKMVKMTKVNCETIKKNRDDFRFFFASR